MTIENAINLFNRLISGTQKSSEIKVYNDFIDILTTIQNRNFSKTDLQSIESKIDTLDLHGGSQNSLRHFKRALQQLKQYLAATFSLISKGYYINQGIIFGSFVGLMIGIIFLSSFERSVSISLGISMGTVIGLIIATYLESQAKAAGNLI